MKLTSCVIFSAVFLLLLATMSAPALAYDRSGQGEAEIVVASAHGGDKDDHDDDKNDDHDHDNGDDDKDDDEDDDNDDKKDG